MNLLQLEQCIKDYGKDIYSFCKTLTRNLQEADELYQDTFLKATEIMKKIEYQNNPKSYLISIALHLWKNKQRKTAWRMRISGERPLEDADELIPSNALLPEDELIQKETILLVRKAVSELEEKYRIPIYLYYTAELSVSEISQILKLPQGTVKTRLYQARKQIKSKLEVVLDEK